MSIGKFEPHYKQAYIAVDGKEQSVTWEFEILTGSGLEWIADWNGHVPQNTIEGGYTKSGEKVFVGRTPVNNILQAGKIVPSRKGILCSFASVEHHDTLYEVLVLPSVKNSEETSIVESNEKEHQEDCWTRKYDFTCLETCKNTFKK